MKRTVSIQDISCFGRCSLTVALPTLSAMGIETAILPTAILSTHTAGFQGFTFCDLTDEMDKIASHWQKEGITFDSIGTGYLGSDEQIATVLSFFETFGKEALIFVDPVMADHGKLYPAFSEDFPQKMARLCEKADVIVPNLTEAAFLLGEPFVGSDYDEGYIHALLKRLHARFGTRLSIVTGVTYQKDKQGAVAYDGENDCFYEYFGENLPVSFHGTGDVFSSSLCGALTLGMDTTAALKVAVDYTIDSIRATMGVEDIYWYGVNFEKGLNALSEVSRRFTEQ
ncbi:MAG: pyridoxamine kinase [Clostridia bacterium]|nr:pyridoxamine kinase [Clostridia bacterium]